MNRIFALRRKGTAKMRYIEAENTIKAEGEAMYRETTETGMSGQWQVFKTSFTPKHWEKEKETYMGIYKTTAVKMFEEEKNV